MFRWGFLAAALVSWAAAPVTAQTTRPVDPDFIRAQALVSDGNSTAGRALVDSVLAATPPNAPLYPQALFWRATLASNAADAESDYRHIVVDYPLAPQAEDALLRLAQLELARGDRDGALAHLHRISRDYPQSKSLARANYWIARVLFEKNDIAGACAANASAVSQVAADEIELRNQIQYQGQRCPAVAAIVSAKPPTTDGMTASVTASTMGSSSPAPDTSGTRANGVNVAPPDSGKAKPPTEVREAKPSAVASTKRRIAYSVQVAAYNREADAKRLASVLRKRGYEARVDGEVVPFRVRIGRYQTAGEAEEALKRIKAKHMNGFVVRFPAR